MIVLVVACLLAVPVAAAASSPSPAGLQSDSEGSGPQFPASWEGIWTVTTTVFDCDTGHVVDNITEVDTICAGEALDFAVDGVEISCTGTIDDTSIAASCTGTYEAFPGCTADITSDLSGTRQGDTFDMKQTIRVDLPRYCPFPDQCFRATLDGVRTASGEGVCAPASPVEPTSWGVIKARYGSSD